MLQIIICSVVIYHRLIIRPVGVFKPPLALAKVAYALGLSICLSVCMSVCLPFAKMHTKKRVFFSKIKQLFRAMITTNDI